MVNYSNSIIYKLCCKDPEIKEIYVGSTTNFYRRKQEHKSNCNNSNCKNYNSNVYEFIRNNGGFDNWEMIEIERYNAIDKQDLRKRERYFLEQLEASLNMYIPITTIEEKKEYRKKYREENQENYKKYYQDNQEKCKENHKKYYQENQAKIKEHQKKYYQENQYKIKEQKKEYARQKVVCNVCNKEMRKDSLTRHKKDIHNI